MKLIEETELNALDIDVKGDRGWIPYKSAIPLAVEVGATKITTVKDMPALFKSFKERGIYTIARISYSKIIPWPSARPDWAVKGPGGVTWKDRESLAWVDPFRKEVWEYNIQIAVEAALPAGVLDADAAIVPARVGGARGDAACLEALWEARDLVPASEVSFEVDLVDDFERCCGGTTRE